jgi:hypothetical protein
MIVSSICIKSQVQIAAAARPATTKLACQPFSIPRLVSCMSTTIVLLSSSHPATLTRESPLHKARFHFLFLSRLHAYQVFTTSSLVPPSRSGKHPPVILVFHLQTPAPTDHARHPGAASYLASTNRSLYRKRSTPAASTRRLCSRAPNTPQTRATGARTATMAAARGHAEDERRRGREVLPALLGFWRLAGGV